MGGNRRDRLRSRILTPGANGIDDELPPFPSHFTTLRAIIVRPADEEKRTADDPPEDPPSSETGARSHEDPDETPDEDPRLEPAGTTEAEAAPPDDEEDDLPEWEPLTPELVEEEAERGDFMLRWAVVLLALMLGCYSIHQTSTLLRTRTGQYLAGHGVLPPRGGDIFSLTAHDRDWINLGWGTDLILGGLYELPGQDIWLSLFAALTAALTVMLIVHIARPGIPTWWTSIVVAMAVLAGFPQFVAGPESITLLGLALMMWLLHRWSQSDQPRDLWLLVPVQLVWANLDPRAFLGLALLLLYGVGEYLGARLERPGLLGGLRRKQYWMATGACLLAILVNPFHFHTLTAPLMLYGTEYPALRPYNMLSLSQAASIDRFQYYPLTAIVYFRGHWGNWHWLNNYHVIAGLLLLVTSGVLLYLNRRRTDLGHVTVLAGFTLLALAGTRELAPAALIAAVLAGLNAQDWFRVTFPQEYSINSRELLFSRGGRALTVVAFFALAILGITGRLTPQHGRKLGLGFSPELRALIDGMTVDLNDRLFTASSDLQDDLERGHVSDTLRKLFANKELALPKQVTLHDEQRGRSWLIRGIEPGSDYRLIREGTRLVIYRDYARDESRRGFNFVPEQGDVMIWIGQRPFIDSRARLYSGSGTETDLLDLHRRTRAALRLRRIVIGDENQQQNLNVQVTNETAEEIEITLPPGGDDLRATISRKDIIDNTDSDQPLYPVLAPGLSRVWRKTFDTYEITHVLPRLSGSLRPDYRSMFALSDYSSDWQLLRIGSTTAVFFLKTDATRTIREYLKTHKLDFTAAAFRTVTDKLEPRAELAQPASPYSRYLTPRRDIPVPSIEQGRHYAHMLIRRQAFVAYQAALQEVPTRLANKELIGDIDGVPAISILADTAALAFLAIRTANKGLALDPNNARGFEVLGTAYACLDDIENALRGEQVNSPNARRRYFQAILAMNQALVIDPDNAEVLRQRFQRYRRFNRLDLALDSLRRYDVLKRLPPDASDEQRALRRRQIDDPLQEMISEVERWRKELQQAFEGTGDATPGRMEIAMELTREDPSHPVLILLALETINEDPQLASDRQSRLLKARWMMEAGIFHDEATATTLEDLLQAIGEETGQSGNRGMLAISRLAYSDYDQAAQLWTGEMSQLENSRLNNSLRHMPLFLRPQQWPFDQISSTMSLILQLPSERSEIHFNVAICHLEAGRVNQASDQLVRLLEDEPDSHLRPLAQFYLTQIVNKELELSDLLGPADMISVEPEMFLSEPAAKPETKD